MKRFKKVVLTIASLSLALIGARAYAQGCVAAHSSQRPFEKLLSQAAPADPPAKGHSWVHNLTVDVGYRVFNSNKYFQGSNEIPRANAVRNHQNIFDVGVEYQLSKRWSILADIPVFDGTRNQIYPPSGIFQVSGLGDITVGLQSWLFRAPTESGGDLAVDMQLKIPTGIDNATGAARLNGKTVIATADQSLQPGDGTWGFSVGTQGYKQLWHAASLYAQGNYLFSPADTNGVPTFRSQPGQGVMSATDQYLFRGGVSQTIPRIRRLALSGGVRGEGVPVHDLLGASDGFRRPGFIFSFDPGFMFKYRNNTLSVNGPWALYRDRPPSVPEIQYNITNGDAFFADYTVIVNLSHHF